MCTNNFYPKITLPTRFQNTHAALSIKCFAKFHTKITKIFHLLLFWAIYRIIFPVLFTSTFYVKVTSPQNVFTFVRQRIQQKNNFWNNLSETDIVPTISSDQTTDLKAEYAKFEQIITTAYEKHFPEKRVKFNKHEHKLSDWITSGIWKSIEFRDILYRRLNKLSMDSPDYELVKCNLKIYNRYLNQCICNTKKDYYALEFTKYKGDIKKTRDTSKDILNKKKGKSKFPAYFLCKNGHVSGAQNVANKFSEYFINIGPDLASSIDTSNKTPFDSYLNTPCSNSFLFQYSNPTDIAKIICQLKRKSSAGYYKISSILLKEITDSISCPLSKIINQTLCTGIFPSKLKLAKFIPLLKKDDEKEFGNYHPISLLSSI